MLFNFLIIKQIQWRWTLGDVFICCKVSCFGLHSPIEKFQAFSTPIFAFEETNKNEEKTFFPVVVELAHLKFSKVVECTCNVRF